MMIYIVFNKHFDAIRAFSSLSAAQYFVKSQSDSIYYSIQYLPIDSK